LLPCNERGKGTSSSDRPAVGANQRLRREAAFAPHALFSTARGLRLRAC
jgi:hypothetical protein